MKISFFKSHSYSCFLISQNVQYYLVFSFLWIILNCSQFWFWINPLIWSSTTASTLPVYPPAETCSTTGSATEPERGKQRELACRYVLWVTLKKCSQTRGPREGLVRPANRKACVAYFSINWFELKIELLYGLSWSFLRLAIKCSNFFANATLTTTFCWSLALCFENLFLFEYQKAKSNIANELAQAKLWNVFIQWKKWKYILEMTQNILVADFWPIHLPKKIQTHADSSDSFLKLRLS